MRKRFLISIMDSLLFIFVTALLSLPAGSIAKAQGSSFYVATGGSDTTGDGSSSNPWATIDHALAQAPDNSLILVQPGDYFGVVRLDEVFSQGVIVRSEVPYQARLRNSGTVVRCYYGQGITLEGFDIAHSGGGAGRSSFRSKI